MKIDSTAWVSDSAVLGSGVEIGPFAVVGDEVRVGDGCAIGPHAVLHPGTVIEERCTVHAHACIGDVPQDLSFEPARSGVLVGAGTVMREGVTIHRGTRPDSMTEVGRGCFLMAHAHVAHNCRLGDRVIMANGVLLAGYVEVGSGAFLSGNCLVHQFTRIGPMAMLSGGSAVGKDVPPFCTVPALTVNRVAGLNVVGMRRAGLAPEERLAVKRAFALLYRSGLNVSQAIEAIRKESASGPAREFAEFLDASTRGICAGPGSDSNAE